MGAVSVTLNVLPSLPPWPLKNPMKALFKATIVTALISTRKPLLGEITRSQPLSAPGGFTLTRRVAQPHITMTAIARVGGVVCSAPLQLCRSFMGFRDCN